MKRHALQPALQSGMQPAAMNCLPFTQAGMPPPAIAIYKENLAAALLPLHACYGRPRTQQRTYANGRTAGNRQRVTCALARHAAAAHLMGMHSAQHCRTAQLAAPRIPSHMKRLRCISPGAPCGTTHNMHSLTHHVCVHNALQLASRCVRQRPLHLLRLPRVAHPDVLQRHCGMVWFAAAELVHCRLASSPTRQSRK